MYKPIQNSWEWEEYPYKIINRGMSKMASWYGTYSKDPDHTLVSGIFLGAGEYYGSNRNGDYFPEIELMNSYKTFLDGKHYKHHEDNPLKIYGSVTAIFYNEKMHRVEGVIKLENKKNESMIERISGGEPVPLSMGCNVDHDVCSICGNKAKTIKAYCKHLKERMCEIEPDGTMVYAINIKPKFYDISEVKRGADKTAWALKKVAGEGGAPKQVKLSSRSLQYLKRLASIEKRIDMSIDKVLTPLIPSKKCHSKITPELLGEMSKEGAAFQGDDFGVEPPGHIFNYLLTHPKLGSILENMPDEGELPIGNTGMRNQSLLCKNASVRDRNYILPLKKATEEDMLKIASLNLAIVSNNPSLLEDKVFPYLMVIQNIRKD